MKEWWLGQVKVVTTSQRGGLDTMGVISLSHSNKLCLYPIQDDRTALFRVSTAIPKTACSIMLLSANHGWLDSHLRGKKTKNRKHKSSNIYLTIACWNICTLWTFNIKKIEVVCQPHPTGSVNIKKTEVIYQSHPNSEQNGGTRIQAPKMWSHALRHQAYIMFLIGLASQIRGVKVQF